MGLLNKVNPKLAQDIEEDMAELDRGSKKVKSSTKTTPCPDCAESMIGPGLLDAHTQCSNCEGTGTVTSSS